MSLSILQLELLDYPLANYRQRLLPGHSDGIVGVKEPREIRHVRDPGETEEERDQFARFSLKPRLSGRENPNEQEVC